MKKILPLLLLLIALLGAFLAADAATENDAILSQNLVATVSMYEDGAITSYVDDGSASLTGKRAVIHEVIITGGTNKLFLLTRVQQAGNGLFIDLIPATSIAELTTAVAAMDFSSDGVSHPSPSEDAVDTSVTSDATP